MRINGCRASGRRPFRGLLAVVVPVLIATSSGCLGQYERIDLWPHAGEIAAEYTSVGKVRVAEFEDLRNRPADGPSEEPGTAGDSTARKDSALIKRLETKPPATYYLRKIMVAEAARTGIFTVDEAAALTLNVDLLSLKSTILYTPMGGICEVCALAFLIGASEPVVFVYAGSALVLTCPLEFPANRAEVRYRATLAREGKNVFSTEILTRCSERFWMLGHPDPLGRRDDAGMVMSRCMTKSVKDLFEQLSRSPLRAVGAAPGE